MCQLVVVFLYSVLFILSSSTLSRTQLSVSIRKWILYVLKKRTSIQYIIWYKPSTVSCSHQIFIFFFMINIGLLLFLFRILLIKQKITQLYIHKDNKKKKNYSMFYLPFFPFFSDDWLLLDTTLYWGTNQQQQKIHTFNVHMTMCNYEHREAKCIIKVKKIAAATCKLLCLRILCMGCC